MNVSCCFVPRLRLGVCEVPKRQEQSVRRTLSSYMCPTHPLLHISLTIHSVAPHLMPNERCDAAKIHNLINREKGKGKKFTRLRNVKWKICSAGLQRTQSRRRTQRNEKP